MRFWFKTTAVTAIAIAAVFIPPWEGTIYKTYLDPIGIPTACTGHTGPDVKIGKSHSTKQCEEWLLQDIKEADTVIDKYVKVSLPAKTRAAYISIIFNIGEGNFRKSTLLKKTNFGDLVSACNQFSRFVYSGGRILPGLVKRREAERQLCLSGLK